MTELESQTLMLPDGRTLGFAEYGDPGGVPVVSFHGGISSRLDARPSHEAAERLGIRLLAPDRPGMGLSTYQPRRTLLDWPADMAVFADVLGLDRFAALGWSAGGPYAVACAYALGDRVSGIALLSSAAPFEILGTRRGLNGPDRVLLALCRWAPPLAALTLEGAVVRPPAGVLRSTVAKGMTPRDMEALDRSGPPEASLAFVKESCRAGTRGVIRDYRIFGDPWGFLLEDVAVPTAVWEGTEDTTGPPSYSATLAERIPGATLTLVPGEGHFSLPRNHATEILTSLLGTLR